MQVVYNGLLFVCARDSSSTLEDGYAVLTEMEEAGLTPDAYTYATLLDLVSRRGANRGDAEAVLARMQEAQVPLTTTVLNTHLKVLGKGAEQGTVSGEEAVEVVKGFENLGVKIDVITLSTLSYDCPLYPR